MQLKQKKRIDISEDPLFFSNEPVLLLRKLKQKKTIDFENRISRSERRKQSLEFSNFQDISLTPSKLKQQDHGKIMNYIRVQNREINQVKLKQKELNRSRILPSPLEKIRDDSLPAVDQFLFRKTINNIVRKSQLKQNHIEKSLKQVETYLSQMENINDGKQLQTNMQNLQNPSSTKVKTIRNEDHSFPSFRSQVMEITYVNQQRDRSSSIKKTIEEIGKYKGIESFDLDKKQAKVNEIIYKTEETREKSMAAKLFVYSEKPDSIQPTKKQLQQLRYKWVRRLKYKIELHKIQLNQFMAFLQYLKESDMKVHEKDKLYLQAFRDKLEIGDHLSDKEIQNMVEDNDTQQIGSLLRSYIPLQN